jgi:hypothetical protein
MSYPQTSQNSYSCLIGSSRLGNCSLEVYTFQESATVIIVFMHINYAFVLLIDQFSLIWSKQWFHAKFISDVRNRPVTKFNMVVVTILDFDDKTSFLNQEANLHQKLWISSGFIAQLRRRETYFDEIQDEDCHHLGFQKTYTIL